MTTESLVMFDGLWVSVKLKNQTQETPTVGNKNRKFPDVDCLQVWVKPTNTRNTNS